jgi:hypothetical protein
LQRTGYNSQGLLPDKAQILETIPGVGSKIANCTLEMTYERLTLLLWMDMAFIQDCCVSFNRTPMGGAGQILRGEMGDKTKNKFSSELKKRSEELGVSWCIENWL